ncbi:hypothetical protein [Marivita hallyeonensis]|uniref:Uncharacterized protein n=1 Tax=Marivita hallyeonensis TaxID=996342 RepID=A0A1M5MN48_9RHOB|nr:hypothetical protein [Marivita hallyeonensis]SHG78854.1 hypothetical protein SAMN05443551_0586 [Marivita hallyeonensis]
MTAPSTNIEKQKKRHRPALLGMAAVVIFAGVLLLGYLTVLAERGTPANDVSGEIAVEPSQ